MDTLFKVLLMVHIFSGSVGLITGSFNLIRRKGDKKHRTIGKIFTSAMLTAGFSSLALSIIHPNFFLSIVGTFTIYLVGTGNRYIYLKMLGINQKPAYLDWALTLSMFITGIVFLVLGMKNIVQGNYFGIVLCVFGIFSLILVRSDFVNYSGKSKAKNYWLLAHIQRMTGGYIAASTAFLVVNAQNFPIQVPPVLAWLFPTIVLVPFIVKWSGKYVVKKKGNTSYNG